MLPEDCSLGSSGPSQQTCVPGDGGPCMQHRVLEDHEGVGCFIGVCVCEKKVLLGGGNLLH